MLNVIEKVDYIDFKMGFLEERIYGKDYIVLNFKVLDYNWKLMIIVLYSEFL